MSVCKKTLSLPLQYSDFSRGLAFLKVAEKLYVSLAVCGVCFKLDSVKTLLRNPNTCIVSIYTANLKTAVGFLIIVCHQCKCCSSILE